MDDTLMNKKSIR